MITKCRLALQADMFQYWQCSRTDVWPMRALTLLTRSGSTKTMTSLQVCDYINNQISLQVFNLPTSRVG